MGARSMRSRGPCGTTVVIEILSPEELREILKNPLIGVDEGGDPGEPGEPGEIGIDALD